MIDIIFFLLWCVIAAVCYNEAIMATGLVTTVDAMKLILKKYAPVPTPDMFDDNHSILKELEIIHTLALLIVTNLESQHAVIDFDELYSFWYAFGSNVVNSATFIISQAQLLAKTTETIESALIEKIKKAHGMQKIDVESLRTRYRSLLLTIKSTDQILWKRTKLYVERKPTTYETLLARYLVLIAAIAD
jgi:hypothetical protein